jgi:drug/metabolite transporter (DMT)-like permease
VPAVLALLSSLLWGSSDFLGGILSRRLPAALVVALSQAAGLVAVAAAAVIAGAFGAPLGYIGWAIGAGLAGVIGLVAFYAALASGTMGVVSPIAALGVVVPVLVGVGQGERPGPLQVVGIVVAIAGVVLASGPELSGRAGARPLVLAVVAACGFGLALLFIAKGSHDSILMTMLTMRITSVSVLGVALAVMAARARRAGAARGPRLEPRDFALLAVVGVADAGANLSFGWSSTRGLISVAAVLGSLYPVATVLLARGFLNERLGRAQSIGVVGALAGVVLIAAG